MTAAARTIHELLPLVSSAIGPVGKDQLNAFDKYKFRGIDGVLAACHRALAKYGVTVVPEVLSYELRDRASHSGKPMVHILAKVRHTFCAPDGSRLACVTFGEAMDRGDKAGNKAMSAAYKYALCLTLCLPVALPDADSESPSIEGPAGTKRDQFVEDLKRRGITSPADKGKVHSALTSRLGKDFRREDPNSSEWERAAEHLPYIEREIRGD